MIFAADAILQLGPRAVGHWAWHQAQLRSGRAARALLPAEPPGGPFLPAGAAAAPPLPDGHARAVLEAAARLPAAPAWHGPFDPAAHALSLDLFAPGDVRPVWERSRLAFMPLLAQAHRLAPQAGHLARAEALLAQWCAANPPFRGPNWFCAQEAALRVLHFALALVLLGSTEPLPGARQFLLLHRQRLRATPAYAEAQDNNHPLSEAAGLLACALLLRDQAGAARAATRLRRTAGRLITLCGSFAQPSAGYSRLALDTLVLATLLCRRHGRPDPVPPPRVLALAEWLFRVAGPDGAMPPLGHCDDSNLADLSLAGPHHAAASLERAARLLAGRSAGFPADPGCRWLGLDAAAPGAAFTRPARWQSEGWQGHAAGAARALLRTGPLRFRPGHADLLHLELWDGATRLLRDGGSGSYNPRDGHEWWLDHFPGTAAHNTITFADAAGPHDQMPRRGRFRFGRWPRTALLPDGARYRDWRGNRHARALRAEGRCWTVEDRVSGPFRALCLRWRLAPAAWRRTADGAASPLARLAVLADAPLRISLAKGWESPRYGTARRIPVLEIRAESPVTWLRTSITLPTA